MSLSTICKFMCLLCFVTFVICVKPTVKCQDANPSVNPLQLLTYNDDTGVFSICPPALRFFESLGERNVVITSVIGTARVGKSFLINQLLDRRPNANNSFKVGAGGLAVTNGIWIAHAETKAPASRNTPLHLFMDVEGFGGLRGKKKNFAEESDPKLALLASVLSTNLLYVVANGINQDNIRFLHAVAELDEVMQVRHNITTMSPGVTWVVHGLAPDLSDLPSSGYPATPEGYLASALHVLQDDSGQDINDDSPQGRLNRIISFLRKKLHAKDPQEKRSQIFILGTPSASVDRKDYEEIDPKDYLPHYANEVAKLKDAILSRATVKRANGTTLHASFLRHFLPALVNIANQEKHIGAELVEGIIVGARRQCTESLNVDWQILNTKLPLPLDELNKHISAANTTLQTCFHTALGQRMPSSGRTHRAVSCLEDMLLNLRDRAHDIVNRNALAFSDTCFFLCDHMLKDANEKSLTFLTDTRALDAFLQQLEANFSAACSPNLLEDGESALKTKLQSIHDKFSAEIADIKSKMTRKAYDTLALVLFLFAPVAISLLPCSASGRLLGFAALLPQVMVFLNTPSLLRLLAPVLDAQVAVSVSRAAASTDKLLFQGFQLSQQVVAQVTPLWNAVVVETWSHVLWGVKQLVAAKNVAHMRDMVLSWDLTNRVPQYLAAKWAVMEEIGLGRILGMLVSVYVIYSLFCSCCCCCSRRRAKSGVAG